MKRRAWLLLAVASCSGRCGAARADREAPRDDDEPIPLEPAEGRDADVLGPSRCAQPVADAAQVQLVGNAILGKTGVWVSAVTAKEPALAVLTLPGSAVVVLRPQPGDAPAPVLAADGDAVIAAYFGAPLAAEQRLELARIAAPGQAAVAIGSFTRARDESLAVDVAVVAGVPYVIWTEDGELVVRSATTRVVLPAPSRTVLESPRLLEHAGGLVVMAIARAWESPDAAMREGPQSTWEGAGEPRSTSWLVGYALRGDASPAAAVGLTPPRGHVDAFDVARPDGKPEALTAFVRDAARTDARGGGSLVRVRWTLAGDPVRSLLRSGDVGSGPMAVVSGTLSYGTAAGDAVLVPLTADLGDASRASREPSLDDARMLGTWPGRGILLAGPTALSWLPCVP